MSERGLQRWITVALSCSVLALGCAVGLQKIRTFDYWWHLRTGALIAETGTVPTADVYTYTVPGTPWIDIHWLFQLGLHAVYSLGGHPGVVVGKVVFVCALLAALSTVGWRRNRPVVTAIALSLMLLVVGDRIMPRPELPSFLLLAAVLALLERHERRSDAWVFAIVPLQILWVNMHGLFALGLALCAIYAASEFLRPLVQPGESLSRDRVWRLGALTLLAGLAALCNPNALDGALYPVEQLGMIGPPDQRGLFGSLIAELIPPLQGAWGSESVTLALVGTLALASFGAMALNWRRLSGAHPLLWVSFAFLGLSARRNLALAAVVFAPILVRNLNEFLDRHPAPMRALRAAGIATALVLALLVVDVVRGSFFARIGAMREPGLGVSEIFYPSAAVEWIAREDPPGPLCHHMADGGYLIWHLRGRYPVMVDGRLEVYGAERFAELQVTGPERFRALDEKYHFGSVLVHYSLASSESLLWWLHLNANWQLVFLDDAAAVFVRLGEGDSRWQELNVDAPDLFPELRTEPGVVDRARRMARANWYVSLRRYQPALAVWEAMLERYPDIRQGPLMHAMLLMRTGKAAAAETILRRELAERPADAALLSQAGDLRFYAGDLSAAGDLYDRALAVDPRLAYAVLQLGRIAEAQGDLAQALLLYSQVIATTHALDPRALEAAQRMAALGAH
jgi:hypothetical protein